jgi:LPS O-antigen subunit length determinant protein (WzzB/FepE family)
MKKNSNLYNDEIDLISFLKIIFNGKFKIFFIAIISFLIGLGYSYKQPNNYLYSLTIKPSDNAKFVKVSYIYNFFEDQEINENKKTIFLERFITELEDYNEFLINLKNTKKVRRKISELNSEEVKNRLLFKYAKLLEIERPNKKKNETDYTLKLIWDNTEEAIDILQGTINLTLNNFQNLINNELEENLKLKKKKIQNNDFKKLNFLSEQSTIAKELNIVDNQVTNDNLTQTKVSLNIKTLYNTHGIAYYLRGYKAIDKEIELIKNRNYNDLEFIEKEINFLKKENINWINYNIYLTQIKSLKNSKKNLLISILLGLIIGIIYVLISNAFQFQAATKKKTK